MALRKHVDMIKRVVEDPTTPPVAAPPKFASARNASAASAGSSGQRCIPTARNFRVCLFIDCSINCLWHMKNVARFFF